MLDPDPVGTTEVPARSRPLTWRHDFTFFSKGSKRPPGSRNDRLVSRRLTLLGHTPRALRQRLTEAQFCLKALSGTAGAQRSPGPGGFPVPDQLSRRAEDPGRRLRKTESVRLIPADEPPQKLRKHWSCLRKDGWNHHSRERTDLPRSSEYSRLDGWQLGTEGRIEPDRHRTTLLCRFRPVGVLVAHLRADFRGRSVRTARPREILEDAHQGRTSIGEHFWRSSIIAQILTGGRGISSFASGGRSSQPSFEGLGRSSAESKSRRQNPFHSLLRKPPG